MKSEKSIIIYDLEIIRAIPVEDEGSYCLEDVRLTKKLFDMVLEGKMLTDPVNGADLQMRNALHCCYDCRHFSPEVPGTGNCGLNDELILDAGYPAADRDESCEWDQL